MESKRRAILSQVAAGMLSPEEAAGRLEEVDAEGARLEGSGSPSVSRVRLEMELGTVEVIGDPTVAEVAADGPHLARREGATLIIEGRPEAGGGTGFQFGRQGVVLGQSRRLQVRMNPALELDAEIQAGSLRVRGLEAAIRADVEAGSTVIDGFKGPLDISVQAGSLKATGRLDAGQSKISCEAGSVKLHLEGGSDVRVVTHSEMGRVTLPGGSGAWVLGGGDHEAVIGGGRARLDIDSQMGSIKVSADA